MITNEEFITKIKFIIASNNEEIRSCMSNGWSRNLTYRNKLIEQNKLWEFALKLAERP